MQRLGYLPFILLLGLSSPLRAQLITPVIESIPLTELPSGASVNELFKDQRGLLWLGTSDGLFQYDGYEWKGYQTETFGSTGLRNDLIFSLCEDDSATLWLATGNGLVAADQYGNRFASYYPEPQMTTANTQLSFEQITFAQSYVWLTTWHEGLLRFDRRTQTFRQYLPSTHPRITHDGTTALLEDRAGTLWVGTQQGLCRFDSTQGSFDCYQYDTLQAASKSNHVNTLYEDPEGMMWVGTYRGILRFDRTLEQFTHYPVASDTSHVTRNFVRSMAPDGSEYLWLGTYDNVVRFRKEDGAVTVLADTTQRPPQQVKALLNDKTGALWMGTTDGTLDRVTLHPKPFGYLTDSLSRAAITVLEDAQEKVWYGTAQGLYRTDRRTGQTQTIYRAPLSLAGINQANIIAGLAQDRRGTVWFGTGYGQLYGVDTVTLQIDSVSNLPIRDGVGIWELYVDHHDRLWIATGGDGLLRYDLGTEQVTRYVHEEGNPRSLQDNFVGPITEDATGQIWLGTTGGGLQRLDPETGYFQSYQHDLTDSTSLLSDHVASLHSPHAGVLWVGTTQGLSQLDTETGRFTSYQVEDGLPSEKVCAIAEDETGNLWVSTDHGLTRFDPERATFSNYFTTDGLMSDQFMFGALSRGSDGEILLGTERGVVTFLPAEIRKVSNEYAPLLLRQVNITNQRTATTTVLPGNERWPNEELQVPSPQHTLTFRFALLNYRHPSENRYACWLEGYDTDWQHLGQEREVTYAQLPPGTYTLRVKAANRDMTWILDQLAIPIVVTAPFWTTGWFIALSGLLGVGLMGWVGYRWARFSVRRFASPLPEETTKADSPPVLTPDEQFLRQATQVVEANLDNPAFKVDDFSRETGVSRTLLYQKIRRLTGQSVNDFMRSVRLRRAHDLLREQDLTIAEVAHQVGFNNPSYFSKCFQREYGMLPSQYHITLQE